MPTASVRSSFLARQAAAVAIDRGGRGDDNRQLLVFHFQAGDSEFVHEDDDDRRHDPGDHEARHTEGENFLEEDFGAEEDQPDFDEQFGARPGQQPFRHADGVGDQQPDQKRPHGIAEAPVFDIGLMGHPVCERGQDKDDRETGEVLLQRNGSHDGDGQRRHQAHADHEQKQVEENVAGDDSVLDDQERLEGIIRPRTDFGDSRDPFEEGAEEEDETDPYRPPIFFLVQ